MLVHHGETYRGATSTVATFPEELVRLTRASDGAPVRTETDDGVYLAVGVPLGRDNVFLELFPRADLVETLRALWLSLLLSAVVTALVGVAAGRVVARRLLRPVEEVTAAAAAIAGGNLDARLDPHADTDLAELAASFNQTALSLQRRVQADARFAGDVSHELRTPLTTMINSMEALRNRRHLLPPEAREPLDLLDHELTRFRHLVIDLLEVSRDDSGDQGVREPVRAADLVRRAADAAAGRAVTSVAPAAEHLEIEADRRRLAQVVTNLVTNAELHGGGCTAVGVDVVGGDVRGDGGRRRPGSARRRAGSGSSSASPARPVRTRAGSASGWPSWRSTSRGTAGPPPWRTVRGVVRGSPCGSPDPRGVPRRPPWGRSAARDGREGGRAPQHDDHRGRGEQQRRGQEHHARPAGSGSRPRCRGCRRPRSRRSRRRGRRRRPDRC